MHALFLLARREGGREGCRPSGRASELVGAAPLSSRSLAAAGGRLFRGRRESPPPLPAARAPTRRNGGEKKKKQVVCAGGRGLQMIIMMAAVVRGGYGAAAARKIRAEWKGKWDGNGRRGFPRRVLLRGFSAASSSFVSQRCVGSWLLQPSLARRAALRCCCYVADGEGGFFPILRAALEGELDEKYRRLILFFFSLFLPVAFFSSVLHLSERDGGVFLGPTFYPRDFASIPPSAPPSVLVSRAPPLFSFFPSALFLLLRGAFAQKRVCERARFISRVAAASEQTNDGGEFLENGALRLAHAAARSFFPRCAGRGDAGMKIKKKKKKGGNERKWCDGRCRTKEKKIKQNKWVYRRR